MIRIIRGRFIRQCFFFHRPGFLHHRCASFTHPCPTASSAFCAASSTAWVSRLLLIITLRSRLLHRVISHSHSRLTKHHIRPHRHIHLWRRYCTFHHLRPHRHSHSWRRIFTFHHLSALRHSGTLSHRRSRRGHTHMRHRHGGRLLHFKKLLKL